MSTNIEPLRVIIADDHVLYRAGVKTALSAKKDIKIIAEADNGMHLLNLLKNIEADVILLDIQMPIMDGITALPEIKKVAELINTNNYSVVIFPEGTRSKTGIPKPFAVNGLKMLYKFAPDAYFLPITINNSWKMTKFGNFPLGLGVKLDFTIHKPMKISDNKFEEIFEKTEKIITQYIKI